MNLVKNTYIQGGLVQATRPIPPENYKVHRKSTLASIHQHVGEHPMTTSPNLRRLSLKVISRSTSESQMDRPELHCIFKFYTKPRPYLTIHTTFPLHFFYRFLRSIFPFHSNIHMYCGTSNESSRQAVRETNNTN
uniref:Uncharacterized protein n=1 Tax=Cacopsylla melanoneura TaxID=428564 RepID=A0A8D8T4W5_9HEMI